MKRITTYVNPSRVRLVIGELSSGDVKEIKVVTYFKPLSEVSRIDFLCEESSVDAVKRVIHRLGTTGTLPDHIIFVSDFRPQPTDQADIGTKMGRLDD